MTHRAKVIGVLATIIVVLAPGCRTPAPQAPSLPGGFGARVTDGQLRMWTGSPCTGVTRVTILFSPESARLTLEPSAGQVAVVDYLTLGGPYPGLEVVEPLPTHFDWREAKTMMFVVEHAAERTGGAQTDIAEVIQGSEAHPDDTYYFQGVGWLTPADVEARDGKDILTACTPDPKK